MLHVGTPMQRITKFGGPRASTPCAFGCRSPWVSAPSCRREARASRRYRSLVEVVEIHAHIKVATYGTHRIEDLAEGRLLVREVIDATVDGDAVSEAEARLHIVRELLLIIEILA